jgi:hypothetical protein
MLLQNIKLYLFNKIFVSVSLKNLGLDYEKDIVYCV